MHLAKTVIASVIVITSSLFIASASADTPTTPRAAAPRPPKVTSTHPSHPELIDAAINAEVNRRAVAVMQFAAAINAQHAADAAAEAARVAALPKPAPRPVSSTNVTATSSPSPSGERCQYAGLIRAVWQQDAEWAIGIAWRESNCTAGATNSSHANGVFQMLGHHDIFEAIGCTDEFNAECNVRAAWQLYQGSGRRPWNL